MWRRHHQERLSALATSWAISIPRRPDESVITQLQKHTHRRPQDLPQWVIDSCCHSAATGEVIHHRPPRLFTSKLESPFWRWTAAATSSVTPAAVTADDRTYTAQSTTLFRHRRADEAGDPAAIIQVQWRGHHELLYHQGRGFARFAGL
jgi:hypothetical protein